MSTIDRPRNYVDTACQTMSFDEIVEQAVKEKQRLNDKVVEELKPLCEELPHCALDPVTYEPMEIPLVMRCGHTFMNTTLGEIAKSKKQTRKDKIECAICKTKTIGHLLYYDKAFGETVQHFKKIKGVFEDYASQETEDYPKKKKERVE